MLSKRRLLFLTTLVLSTALTANKAHSATLGFADVVLDYFDSGAGPIPGPYGGEFPGGIGFPVPVSTDVVLGDDPGSTVDFLSLPTDSFVTVGFTDETVVDGDGDDIFIQEVAPQREEANVFVSSDLEDFTFLGIANDGVTTSFDLASIGFSDPVQAIKIEGLDDLGDSPGFDVVNVRVLPGSIGEPPEPEPEPEPNSTMIPEPSSLLSLLAFGSLGTISALKGKRKDR